MRRALVFIFPVALALLIVPLSSKAWGCEGHRIVDGVASTYINKQVEDSLKFYLGKSRFLDAGCWMDEIRSDHNFDYMKPWHYINIAKGGVYDPTSTNNIVSVIDSTISRLRHRNLYTKEQVAADIKILMHLIGDLHQPLHTGYAIDRGGNTIEVGFMGHNSNLHKVWDSEIINQEGITADDCLAILKKKDMPPVKEINPVEWMKQSRGYLTAVYDFSNATIDNNYISKAKPIVESELTMAGLRLAYSLNSIFQ